MARLHRIAVATQLIAVVALEAQRPALKVYGDTTGAPPGCSGREAIASIAAWFDAYNKADSVGLKKNTAIVFVFSIGTFTPTDTFTSTASLDSLVRFARARSSKHERMTLTALVFARWRHRRLGFMPFYSRSADDLGPSPVAGLGKAEFWCGRGVHVLNLAPQRHLPGPEHIQVGPPAAPP